MLSRVVFSSQSDHWSTPALLYEALNREFLFTFDPCPLRSDADGLAVNWPGRVFINPPYSNIRAFIEKGLLELRKNADLLVYLVPSRTDTRWMHDLVLPRASEIRFIRGRLKFGESKNSAPFPSMLCVFKRLE